MCSPYEPMKLSLDKHLTWKTCSLLALALAKRVNELHSLSCGVKRLRNWKSCIFSFIAKTNDPSVLDPKFKFTIPLLMNLMDGDKDEMLLCRVRVIRNYLLRTE